MNRTRLAGHAWAVFTLTMIGSAVYTATTISWWWILPAWTAASFGAGLTYGNYLRAGREEQIARRLAALRGTPTAVYRVPVERVEQLRKDTA